ncbi:MAG: 50S ribosomal protein L29 [Chitinophagales bacterium]|nr:50S ribosomal protein L29 [Chitinophagales bacterium]
MPNKLYQEIIGLSDEELEKQIVDNKVKLQRLRFNHTISPLENPNVLGETRRYIARLKTELKKRELSK